MIDLMPLKILCLELFTIRAVLMEINLLQKVQSRQLAQHCNYGLNNCPVNREML